MGFVSVVGSVWRSAPKYLSLETKRPGLLSRTSAVHVAVKKPFLRARLLPLNGNDELIMVN